MSFLIYTREENAEIVGLLPLPIGREISFSPALFLWLGRTAFSPPHSSKTITHACFLLLTDLSLLVSPETSRRRKGKRLSSETWLFSILLLSAWTWNSKEPRRIRGRTSFPMKEDSQLCLLTPLLSTLDLWPSSSFFWRATLLLAAPPFSIVSFSLLLLAFREQQAPTYLLIVILKGAWPSPLPFFSSK